MGMHICNFCDEKMKCSKSFDNLTNYGQCLHSNKTIRELAEYRFSDELKEYKNIMGAYK